MPKFQMFDGLRDPFNHLKHFRQVMTLQCENYPLLCKVFPSSLSNPALAWFHWLPPRSVAPFHELSESFATRYLCSVRQKRSVANLFRTKMEKGESLRDFMKCFGGIIHQLEAISLRNASYETSSDTQLAVL